MGMIGVDLDNTIVNYEGVFHRVAVDQGLIPAAVGTSKGAVRDWLRAAGREDDWTELQGRVYGACMDVAQPYPGAIGFFRACMSRGIPVCIVSHRTRHPFLGEPHDLHAAARGWLERQGFFDPAVVGLAPERVFLELTKEAKLARIGAQGCRVFVDDLPEFLAELAFPAGTEKLLFDPHGLHAAVTAVPRFASWAAVAERVLAPQPVP